MRSMQVLITEIGVIMKLKRSIAITLTCLALQVYVGSLTRPIFSNSVHSKGSSVATASTASFWANLYGTAGLRAAFAFWHVAPVTPLTVLD